MRVCDRCYQTGGVSTTAYKQLTTSDEQVIDLCSLCYQEFQRFLTPIAAEEPSAEEVKAHDVRRRGRPPADPAKR